MLNNDDATVKEMARNGLFFLDFRRRKVPLATATQNNFLGFRRKDSGKLDSQAKGFGVWSDWPDLNDLCNRTGVELEWSQNNGQVDMPITDELITDSSVAVVATINQQGVNIKLLSDTAQKALLSIKQTEAREHWRGLRLQGKLACLDFVDHSTSHSMYRNAAIGEDVLKFTIKARLQVLPSIICQPGTQVCMNHFV